MDFDDSLAFVIRIQQRMNGCQLWFLDCLDVCTH
jgi:hypothetical protein